MVGAVAPAVSWEHALAWRMQQHHLVERAEPAELVRIVSDVCGLHAQVMSSAELSVWARTEGLDRGAVQESLRRRRDLVKLWGARGTLYLLPAMEMGLWLSALGTMPKFGNTGEPDKLAVAVGLKAASFLGLICFGPSKGTQVCFTSPSTWLSGGIERSDPDDALRQIARRFLGGVCAGDRCGPRSLVARTALAQAGPTDVRLAGRRSGRGRRRRLAGVGAGGRSRGHPRSRSACRGPAFARVRSMGDRRRPARASS